MKTRYTETERGRFESNLVREGVPHDEVIAYTDYDCVKITSAYTESDREAVMEFADFYDLPLDITFWA